MSRASTNAGMANRTFREVLSADRTYYVRTDGSNTNTGLTNTSGGAFLTIQKAVDVAQSLDCNGYAVTIQVADGTYTAQTLISGLWGTSQSFKIYGNTTTPANCIVTTTNDAFKITSHNVVEIGGFSISNTGAGGCITAMNGGNVYLTYPLVFRAGIAHLFAYGQGRIYIETNYTITNGAAWHILTQFGGLIRMNTTGKTVTLTGTPAFSSLFVECINGVADYSIATFSGSATGTRYKSRLNGLIWSLGNNTSFFPGSVAGSTETGGLYV